MRIEVVREGALVRLEISLPEDEAIEVLEDWREHVERALAHAREYDFPPGEITLVIDTEGGLGVTRGPI